MKHFQYILVCFILVIAGTSCCKDKGYKSNAVITGLDDRKCACCGGIFLTIDNGTTGVTYRAINNPADLHISQDSNFPLYAKIDWEATSTVCGGENLIHITRYSSR